MRNQRILFWVLFIISSNLGAQTYLENEKFQSCEIFQKKQYFDRQERLDFIKMNLGKKVTVFIIKGKSNKIKRRYTGKIVATDNTVSSNARTNVLTVETQKKGKTIFRFPLTNDKKCRIFWTKCLKNKTN